MVKFLQACRHFWADHIVWTENSSVPVEMRQHVMTAITTDEATLVCIKDTKYKEVFIGTAHTGTRYVVKKRKNSTFSSRIKSLKEDSILRVEYDTYLRLDRLGIAVPRVILIGERYSWGLRKESYLVTEWLAGQTAGEMYVNLFMHAAPIHVRYFLEALARYTTTLCQIGISHSDLNPDNILVKPQEAGQYEFYLLDVGHCRVVNERDPLKLHTEHLRNIAVLILGLWLCLPDKNRPLVYFVVQTLRLLDVNKASRRHHALLLLSFVKRCYEKRVLAKRDRRIYYESEQFGMVRLPGIHGYYKKNTLGEEAHKYTLQGLSLLSENRLLGRKRLFYELREYLMKQNKNFYAAVNTGHKVTSPDSAWTIANKLHNRSLPVFEPVLALEQSLFTENRMELIIMVVPAGSIVGASNLRIFMLNMTNEERQRFTSVMVKSLADCLRLFHNNNCYVNQLTPDSIGILVSGLESRAYILPPFAVCSNQELDSSVKYRDLKKAIDLCKIMSVPVSRDLRHQFLHAYFQRHRLPMRKYRRHDNVD